MKASIRGRPIISVVLLAIVTFVPQVPAVAETKAILLPVDLDVYLLTAGGSRELQPEWSKESSQNTQKAFELATSDMFDPVELPELTNAESAVLAEHMALYEVALRNSISMIKRARMKHKIDNYDYTIGPGLAWLIGKSGSEKLVVFTAEQEHSSAVRGALMVAGIVLATVNGPGIFIVPRFAGSFGAVGVIDLGTGDIEWANYRQPILGDLRNEVKAQEGVDDLVLAFPKGRLMRSKAEY